MSGACDFTLIKLMEDLLIGYSCNCERIYFQDIGAISYTRDNVSCTKPFLKDMKINKKCSPA